MSNLTKSKPVIVTRADGSEIEYTSGSAAARAENIRQVKISKMCRLGVSEGGTKARFK